MSTAPEPMKFIRRPTVFEAMLWDGEYETVKKIHEWLKLDISWEWSTSRPLENRVKIRLASGVLLSAVTGESIIVDRGVVKVIPADKLAELYAPAGALFVPPASAAQPVVAESPQSTLARQMKEARETGARPIAVVAPRGHGKTRQLLQEMLDNSNAVYVGHTESAVAHAFGTYMAMREDLIPNPLPSDVAAQRKRFMSWGQRTKDIGRRSHDYLIDNADIILNINGQLPKIITLTDQES